MRDLSPCSWAKLLEDRLVLLSREFISLPADEMKRRHLFSFLPFSTIVQIRLGLNGASCLEISSTLKVRAKPDTCSQVGRPSRFFARRSFFASGVLRPSNYGQLHFDLIGQERKDDESVWIQQAVGAGRPERVKKSMGGSSRNDCILRGDEGDKIVEYISMR